MRAGGCRLDTGGAGRGGEMVAAMEVASRKGVAGVAAMIIWLSCQLHKLFRNGIKSDCWYLLIMLFVGAIGTISDGTTKKSHA